MTQQTEEPSIVWIHPCKDERANKNALRQYESELQLLLESKEGNYSTCCLRGIIEKYYQDDTGEVHCYMSENLVPVGLRLYMNNKGYDIPQGIVEILKKKHGHSYTPSLLKREGMSPNRGVSPINQRTGEGRLISPLERIEVNGRHFTSREVLTVEGAEYIIACYRGMKEFNHRDFVMLEKRNPRIPYPILTEKQRKLRLERDRRDKEGIPYRPYEPPVLEPPSPSPSPSPSPTAVVQPSQAVLPSSLGSTIKKLEGSSGGITGSYVLSKVSEGEGGMRNVEQIPDSKVCGMWNVAEILDSRMRNVEEILDSKNNSEEELRKEVADIKNTLNDILPLLEQLARGMSPSPAPDTEQTPPEEVKLKAPPSSNPQPFVVPETSFEYSNTLIDLRTPRREYFMKETLTRYFKYRESYSQEGAGEKVVEDMLIEGTPYHEAYLDFCKHSKKSKSDISYGVPPIEEQEEGKQYGVLGTNVKSWGQTHFRLEGGSILRKAKKSPTGWTRNIVDLPDVPMEEVLGDE